jgi:hypothetical protein
MKNNLSVSSSPGSADGNGGAGFSTPSPEQVVSYLREHPASPPSAWSVRMPMLVAVVLIVVSIVLGGPIGALLPWFALAWLFGHSALRAYKAQALETDVRKTQELAMLRRYPEALRRGWRLLPAACVNPMLHSQTVAMISHCLDTLGAYDSAIVGYDYLLERMPAGQPVAVHIGVSRAGASLGAENLSDADDALRRLRGAVEPFNHTPISAAYRLTQLAQRVRTHHFADAVQERDGLIEALRPLGVEAGYGHALMALCYYQQPQNDLEPDGQDVNTQAREWWERATLLLPAGALVGRYPELKPLVELS